MQKYILILIVWILEISVVMRRVAVEWNRTQFWVFHGSYEYTLYIGIHSQVINWL
ncbi:hypothetical protein BKA69DRAFT_1107641 [Paraphysoderma sedebokerense]|nr:hypothetical protein BKA69DRAFT_1107641 [Paraphysoderma sedebokerense]